MDYGAIDGKFSENCNSATPKYRVIGTREIGANDCRDRSSSFLMTFNSFQKQAIQ